MAVVPSITEAEWHVMRVFWEEGSEWLQAADIVEPVARERRINHRTVRTLLARLVKKGAVEARADGGGEGAGSGGGHRYRARIGREAVIRTEARSFLARVFDGEAAPALVHLLQESRDKLSPGDLKMLRELLNKKEKP